MDLSSNYYPYLNVKGMSADLIFRKLCSNKVYKEIENGSWKEKLINRFGNMFAELPNVRVTANRVLHDGMLEKGYDINPEELYFNIFNDYVIPTDPANQNLYHTGNMLKESYRLTDAALMNVFKLRYDGSYYLMKTWRTSGIYKVGKEGSVDSTKPDYGKCWGPHNSAFLAFEPANIVDSGVGIQGEYIKDYDAFWTKYSDLYREMLEDFFLAAAIQQYKSGLLSEYGFAMVRKVYAKQSDVITYWFNVNTYKSNNILVMESKVSGMSHIILYIPGSLIPFIEFETYAQMKSWIFRQLANPAAMEAFLKHFSIANRQDGITYSGVDTLIKNMVDGTDGDPQYYLFRNPEKIPYDAVFNKVRDYVKDVMKDAAEKQITTNSEYYRDYALGFIETLITYTIILEIFVPKIGRPLNIILSLTALGLSSDIVINGDGLQKRMDGVGSLINSTLYLTINLFPFFTKAGRILKTFSRAASEIPLFAEEEQFIVHAFNLESPAMLDNIKPTDPPIVISHESGEIRLVRLADENQPYAVLRRVSANKFVRLDPMTFEELKGERLVSEVLRDSSSTRPVYVSKGTILGGAPYSPYEYFFDEVWTLEELANAADKLGLTDENYVAIKQKLGEMHSAITFEQKLDIAHELLHQLKKYKRAYPLALRTPTLNRLATQIKDVLYPYEMKALSSYLIDSEKGMHPKISSSIYKISQAERLGQAVDGATYAFIKYVQDDPVLSITELSKAPQKLVIPTDLDFSLKYTIPNLYELNKLSENFALLPEYASQGLSTNEEVFKYALGQSQHLGLLTKMRNQQLWSNYGISAMIGYSYDELLSMANEFSSSSATRFGIYPNTVVRMIKGLLKGGNEGEMMQLFGMKNYYESVIVERLDNLEKNLNLMDATNFERFDHAVGYEYKNSFNYIRNEPTKLAKMMESPNGIVMNNGSKELTYCLNNLSYFQEKGVTHIGLTDLFADVHQAELDKFMGGGFLTPTLESIILTVDKGVQDGPLYQLIVAARGKGLKVVALGHSESALFSVTDAFKNSYNKGVVVRNAGRLLSGKKSIVLARKHLINTTPGFALPSVGLAQVLEAPGFAFWSRLNGIGYIPDMSNLRVPIYIKPARGWRKLAPVRGRFLGWRSYGENYTYTTPTQREASVFARIQDNLEEFKQEFYDILGSASRYQCARKGVCDTVTSDVKSALRNDGRRLGRGVSLAWWERDGDTFAINRHTAPTVFIRDTEYVVDASHLQFPHSQIDEGVMILPVNDWAEEILNRVKGHNPYLAERSMSDSSLLVFTVPDFTRPRVRKNK